MHMPWYLILGFRAPKKNIFSKRVSSGKHANFKKISYIKRAM